MTSAKTIYRIIIESEKITYQLRNSKRLYFLYEVIFFSHIFPCVLETKHSKVIVILWLKIHIYYAELSHSYMCVIGRVLFQRLVTVFLRLILGLGLDFVAWTLLSCDDGCIDYEAWRSSSVFFGDGIRFTFSVLYIPPQI